MRNSRGHSLAVSSFDVTFLLPDGEFQGDLKIKGIKQIDVFSDKNAGDNAFITGLTIIYNGSEDPVSHGIVNVNNVGTLTIEPSK